MATETVKSTVITNRDSTPSVKNASKLSGGVLREWVATVEAGAGDTSSKYIMGQLPSGCRISQIQIFSDDVGASGAVNVGIWQTTANGGAVVDADVFAAALDVNAAALNGTDITYQAATSTAQIDDIEKALWEQLNLSADPMRDYDVVIQPSTALATGGTLSLRVRYVVD